MPVIWGGRCLYAMPGGTRYGDFVAGGSLSPELTFTPFVTAT